jgi:hypothetical protein
LGADMEAFNESSGSINDLEGSFGWAENDAGTISDFLIGGDFETGVTAGTVANEYSVFVESYDTGGTVTNRYGVYIEDPSGSAINDYGFYEVGTPNNYFAGNVGIGTTPGAALDVTATGTGNGQGSQGALSFRINDGLGRPAIAAYGNIDGTALVDATASALAVREVAGTGRSITTSGTIAIGGAGNSSYIMSSVGIGTTSPATGMKADLNGAVKVAGTGSEACTASTVGAMRYNSTAQYMEMCQ